MQLGVERDRTVRRTERELARLERLASRARLKRRVFRTIRGGFGAGATLLVLLKTKLAVSLGFKLFLAAMIGLALAWPVAVLGAIFVLGLLVMILGFLTGEGGVSADDIDCCGNCGCKRERMKRLKHLIARRRAWLAAPTGPAPSIRRDPGGRLMTKRHRWRAPPYGQ
ncbi:hypothetical protein BGCPKDLD_4147 [Methylorubrum suomiense]|uniref:Phage holin family protein n=1 Tax=Methylorubrum suomiense TaxID=144191 RepID=A0ABQ4V403_9HYPH|nr:hypothetical protein BGCPKDLD_4147 [Methylorubrum suomiense]